MTAGLDLTGLIARIAVAISEMEGYTLEGSRPERNHNPGNLAIWGDTPRDKNPDGSPGLCIFPTPADGWNALRRQVLKNIQRNLTLFQFFAGQRDAKGKVIKGGYPGFASAQAGNKPKEYADYVGKRVGIPVNVPLPRLILTRESAAQREEA